MLITFGYKKDTYNEKDPYGIESINSNARYTVINFVKAKNDHYKKQ